MMGAKSVLPKMSLGTHIVEILASTPGLTGFTFAVLTLSRVSLGQLTSPPDLIFKPSVKRALTQLHRQFIKCERLAGLQLAS